MKKSHKSKEIARTLSAKRSAASTEVPTDTTLETLPIDKSVEDVVWEEQARARYRARYELQTDINSKINMFLKQAI